MSYSRLLERNNRTKIIYCALVLFGVALSFIVFHKYFRFSSSELSWLERGYMYMKTRWKQMGGAIASVNAGNLPDLTSSSDHSAGLFVWGGIVGSWMGFSEGYEVFAFFQVVFACIMIMVYPIITYFLTHSLLCSILSPVFIHLLLGNMLYIEKRDVAWAAAWVFAVSFPFLIILKRNAFNKKGYFSFACVCLFSSLANIVRTHSALCVMLITVGIVFWHTKKYFNRVNLIKAIIAIIIVLSSYNMLGNTIPTIVLRIDGQTVPSSNDTIWHTVLIGFGYDENNPYGLYYSDSCARDLVAEKYPDIKYHSPEYYKACKEIALDLMSKDPVFCINTLWNKFIQTVKIELSYVFIERSAVPAWMMLILLVSYCAYLMKRKKIKMIPIYNVIICLITFFLGMAQSVLSYPTYIMAYQSTVSIGIFLAFSTIYILNKCEETGLKRLRKRKEVLE